MNWHTVQGGVPILTVASYMIQKPGQTIIDLERDGLIFNGEVC